MPKKGTRKPPEQMKSRYYKSIVNGKIRNTHQLIAEEMLGRPLQPGEVVHHINGDRYDNRPENLMVLKAGEHTTLGLTGRKLTPEHRAHLSESHKGNHDRKGIPHTPETKQHLSDVLKKIHREHPERWPWHKSD